jgi:divinyl protochlorophyllide a 8-vinyl-reductase
MHATAHIGPNAILQHLPLLHSSLGPGATAALLAQAGLAQPPAAHGMVAQATVARFHNAVTQHLGTGAPALQWAAGVGTGRYILANRIPRPAQALLRALPATWGARLLTRAILQHAWTFAGSGQLRVAQRRPLGLELHQNPLAMAAPPANAPSCHWHTAVFQTLFSALIWPAAQARETSCMACGDACCRFEILPHPANSHM